MKAAVVILSILYFTAICLADLTRWYQLSDDYTFEKYMREYGKGYSTPQEHSFRKSVFEANLATIRKHNEDNTKTWKLGVNHLADKTPEEFRRLLGYKKQIAYLSKANKVHHYETVSLEGLPSHVDWREKGIITSVKDQGQCGSCWTFGAAETIESYYALTHGALMDLSEQQILDCTPNPNQCGGTGGCGGGTAELAFTQIMKSGGLSSEWTYPYVSYFGSNYQCHLGNNTVPIAQLDGYVDLPPNSYAPVLSAVATKGPLAVSVDAGTWAFYESGVFNGCNGTNPDLDHEVQLVGYGTDSNGLGDYWLVRNSWSPLWGEKGYIRVHRSGRAECGVDLSPSDGTGCQNGPSSVVVCGTCGILYDATYPLISK